MSGGNAALGTPLKFSSTRTSELGRATLRRIVSRRSGARVTLDADCRSPEMIAREAP